MRLLCFPLDECGLSALLCVSWGKLTSERLVVVQHSMFRDIVTIDEGRPMISLMEELSAGDVFALGLRDHISMNAALGQQK